MFLDCRVARRCAFMLLAAAICLAVLGLLTSVYGHSERARLKRMAEADPAPLLAAEHWVGADPGGPAEVNLMVRFLPRHDLQLMRRSRSGLVESLYLLPFGSVDDAGDPTRILGAVIVSAEDMPRFDRARALGGRVVQHLTGLTDPQALRLPARAALAESGMHLAADPIFVRPYLDGRAAALAAAHAAAEIPRGPSLCYAAAAIAGGLGLRLLARRPPAEPAPPRGARLGGRAATGPSAASAPAGMGGRGRAGKRRQGLRATEMGRRLLRQILGLGPAAAGRRLSYRRPR